MGEAVTGLRNRQEFQSVARLCLRLANRAGWKLEHRMRPETAR